jgi:hypothetical protein
MECLTHFTLNKQCNLYHLIEAEVHPEFVNGRRELTEAIYILRFILKTMSIYSEVLYITFQISSVLAISRFQWLLAN